MVLERKSCLVQGKKWCYRIKVVLQRVAYIKIDNLLKMSSSSPNSSKKPLRPPVIVSGEDDESSRLLQVNVFADDKEESSSHRESYIEEKPTPMSSSVVHYTPLLSPNPADLVASKEYGMLFPHNPDMMVMITMYNEQREELDRTLKGVAENIEYLGERLGDAEFWKRVVVCIVSDGRTKANSDTLDYLTEQGLFSPTLIEKGLGKYGDDIHLHLFEAVVRLRSSQTMNEFHVPMQTMFALKERNGGKIDSHWWCLLGIAGILKPKYVFLLDVGTTPETKSYFYMRDAMERNSNVAGVAGELAPLSSYNLDPIVAAQTFEYKISSILDKTMESVFGYISVLPGAFSAYRYEALLGDPLKMYFHHLKTPLDAQEPFTANMYLAEDRVLCYELVAKKNHNYTLHYVWKAKARTDVPTKLVDLIRQRRRWLNGSLFALIYALLGWGRLLKYSSHNIFRKMLLTLQFVYYLLMVGMQWFSVGNLYLVFFFFIGSRILSLPNGLIWYQVLTGVFLSLLLLQAVIALGNKPNKVSGLYSLSTFLYGVYTVTSTIIFIVQCFDSEFSFEKSPLLLGSLIGTFGSIFLVAILYRSFMEVLVAFIPYMFLSNMYLIIFPIYSLCNIHDISWGTKNCMFYILYCQRLMIF
jgi:chitin synthase